jgi:predicted Ser/Thr protein kinase
VPQVIAGAYEAIREIGSGGGGVVYLARHLRLDKLVVLKADRRKLTAKQEALRREVDALKNLSHQYIPQVYDFVAEDEIVYTVMDFIEGESFDKPLSRGERFTQPQVVEWACQLLGALGYLHGRPPHGMLHADIKPSNIMLTPQGDVRLIDFNIALALGEDGAIAVGRSLGYASPEHLGVDFTPRAAFAPSSRSDARATTVLDSPETVLTPEAAPPSLGSRSGSGSGSGLSSGSSGRKIMLDVRSDIYGLGATLYHILSGIKPAHRIGEVVPLSGKEYSSGLVAVIGKAMNPNPELRYQSASEMLRAFEHLRDSDPRVMRHRRLRAAAAIGCAALFLLGSFAAFTGLKRMQGAQESLTLAEYSANELAAGDVDRAVALALQALPEQGGIFVPPREPQAQKALADALGVYDLSDGYKSFKTLELPSEALKIAIAEGGGIAAAVYAYEVAVFDTETAEVLARLPAVRSALADIEFVGNSLLAYAGEGGVSVYDLAGQKLLWVGRPATDIAVSADRQTLAAVFRDAGEATVYSMDGAELATVPFGGRAQRVAANDTFANPGDNLFALNADGSLLAASFADGSLSVFDLKSGSGGDGSSGGNSSGSDSAGDNGIELLDPSDYAHFEGGFCGRYFAFSATSASESLFAVIDAAEPAETISTALPARIGIHADESGIYMSYNGTHVMIDPLTAVQTPIARDPAEVCAGGFLLESSLDSPVVHIRKYGERTDAEIFSYDPEYPHDEARLSEDSRTVMLFSINGFRLCGIGGEIISETALPDPGGIYDQQYRRDGGSSYLEVIYYDGTVLKYSAADGALMSEISGESPDESLYEEFFTDEVKITSPLHGAPAAYSLKTGRLIRELEKDAYLTYVTQSGGRIVTEYISALDGSRYGLLLDGRTCETLAYFPNLCDVVGDKLIFDLRTGSLRETRIYTAAELIGLAKQH